MSLVLESCNVEELCISYGGSEKLLSELVDKLEEWLKLQPHLPQAQRVVDCLIELVETGVSRKSLEILTLNCKLSLERAKKKLDMIYTIRGVVPEFFSNRNPLERNITAVHNDMECVALPKLTPEKCRVIILRLTQPNASTYNPWDATKYVLMALDVLMADHWCFGEILIYDNALISLGHIIKLTPTFLKRCIPACEQAYAARVKGVHFINLPPVATRLINLVKATLSPKLSTRMHVHPNLESLYQFVPKSVLPKDYGGDQPTMKELSAMLRTRVEESQDWLSEQDKLRVDERLRPGQPFDADSIFGFSGSFRKLDID